MWTAGFFILLVPDVLRFLGQRFLRGEVEHAGAGRNAHIGHFLPAGAASVELEKHCGEKVNGTMFMHIAPWEFQLAVDNPEIAETVGNTDERMSLGGFNSGLFATVLQRGDIRAISCGHSHEDCFEAKLCGISVSLDACGGYSPYGIDSLRGGRVFVIDEKDTAAVTTYMRHYKDLL